MGVADTDVGSPGDVSQEGDETASRDLGGTTTGGPDRWAARLIPGTPLGHSRTKPEGRRPRMEAPVRSVTRVIALRGTARPRPHGRCASSLNLLLT